jgi:hypothetical protein
MNTPTQAKERPHTNVHETDTRWYTYNGKNELKIHRGAEKVTSNGCEEKKS